MAKEYVKDLQEKIFKAIRKELGKLNEGDKVGVLFSGGVDSTLIAYCLKELGVEFICYTAALEGEKLSAARDLVSAREVAKKYGFQLKENILNVDEMEPVLKDVVKIIDSTNVVKAGVAMPLYLCMQKASEDKVGALFSGLGSEEIFAGYERHISEDINRECRKGLQEIQERDLERDNALAEHFNMKLLLPFLEKELVEYALEIPGEYKIVNEHKKMILREAAINIGLKEEDAMRKKLGAQYGSKFDRGLQKLAKLKGFRYKSEYLNNLY